MGVYQTLAISAFKAHFWSSIHVSWHIMRCQMSSLRARGEVVFMGERVKGNIILQV